MSILLVAISCKSNVIDDSTTNNTSIGQLCVRADQCSGGVCTLGYCRQSCTQASDCPAGSVCLAGPGSERGCRLPDEATCNAQKTCTNGLVCATDGSCRTSCNGTCPIAGETCSGGACFGSTGTPPGVDADGGMTGGDGGAKSCFAKVLPLGGVVSASGTVTNRGDSKTLLVDGAAAPFVVADIKAAYSGPPTSWSGYALRPDGTVWGFGEWSGTNASEAFVDTPARVVDIDDKPLPPASRLGQTSRSLFARAAIVDGKVYRWGMFDGTTRSPRAIPIIANAAGDPLKTVVDYIGSEYAGYATMSDGRILALGTNDFGQLGIGTTSSSELYPVQVQGLSGEMISSLATNGNTTCALLRTKEVVCWGSNDGGSLGVGTTTGKANIPGTHVSTGPGAVLTDVTALVDYISGEFAALRSDGSVWGWGRYVSGDIPYAQPMMKTDGAPLKGITRLVGYNVLVDSSDRWWEGAPNVNHFGVPTMALAQQQPSCPP